MMLDIDSVKIRNFLSYGDYDTVLKVSDLGTCLVVGENGSGKSTLSTAILWCLFGRTASDHSPGDSIKNWYNDTGTLVELHLKNGDVIRRTRNVDGHNDLLYMVGGVDVTKSTTKVQQEDLLNKFKIDWDIFCSSMFLTQSGKSLLNLSDVARRAALEHEFNLDRLVCYAEVAKERITAISRRQDTIRSSINTINLSIKTMQNDLKRFSDLAKSFESSKAAKIKSINDELTNLRCDLSKLNDIDVDAIIKVNDLYDDGVKLIDAKYNDLSDDISELKKMKMTIDHKKSIVNEWKNKGDVCLECGQKIDSGHIHNMINGPLSEVESLSAQYIELCNELASRKKTLDEVRDKLNECKPTTTRNDINVILRDRKNFEGQITRQLNALSVAESEVNHYDSEAGVLNDRISKASCDVSVLLSDMRALDSDLLHYEYIHKLYNDRRKLKKSILMHYVPWLNDRITHYSDKLKLGIKLEFTDALGIKTDRWPVKLCSGGQQMRFNLVLMFAMFDLHEEMYGRQCNIIVLDEVDASLDSEGVELFANILKSDFEHRVDAIMVVSHKLDMRGMFDREINIKLKDGFSHIL